MKFCTNKGCQAWYEELVRVNQHILQNGCCMDTKHFFHCIHVPWQTTMVSYVLLNHSLTFWEPKHWWVYMGRVYVYPWHMVFSKTKEPRTLVSTTYLLVTKGLPYLPTHIVTTHFPYTLLINDIVVSYGSRRVLG